MPNELIVSIKADTSGLSAGLADATGQVTAATSTLTAATAGATTSAKSLTAAQAELKASTRALEDAILQLGAAAAQGNASAAAIIAGYQAEVNAAEAVVAALTAEKVASDALTKSTYNRMQAMGVAKVGMGAMTGSVGSMEMGLARLAAGSAVLGPLLQSLIPIAIFAAGAEILFEMAKGAYEAYEKFISLEAVYDKLAQDVEKMQDKDFVNVHSIETATERLDEANRAAVALRDTAQEIHNQNIGDFIGSLLKGDLMSAGMAAGGLGAAHQVAEGSAERTKQAIELTAKQVEEQHALNILKIDDANIAKAGATEDQKRTVELTKQLALHKEEQEYTRLRDKLMGNATPANAGEETRKLQDDISRQQAAQGSTKDDNLPNAIARAQIDAAHAADAALPVAARINAEYLKELDLHKQNAAASKEGTAAEREMLRVIEDEGSVRKRDSALFTAGTAELKKNQEEIAKAAEEQAKHQSEIEKHAVEEFKRAQEERVSAARETAEAEIKAADDTFEAREREIKFEETLGRISHQRATQELLDAENTKAAMMTLALRKEQQIFDPTNGPKELQEFTSVEDKITAEARKAALQREQITQQEAQKFNQAWKKASATFNSDMTTAFKAWATHSQTAGQAWGHMLGEMELQMADFVIKTILQKAEQWAEIKVMDALGFATAKATGGVANVAAAASNAAVAATGAAAAMAAIPVVGPALAVGAATTMTASMAPFIGMAGDYDTGGMLPTMSMAFNRSGSPERILSPSQTSNFESMVNNGGQRSATLNQTNHFGGGVTPDMLAAHTAQTMSKLKGMLRPEAFA